MANPHDNSYWGNVECLLTSKSIKMSHKKLCFRSNLAPRGLSTGALVPNVCNACRCCCKKYTKRQSFFIGKVFSKLSQGYFKLNNHNNTLWQSGMPYILEWQMWVTRSEHNLGPTNGLLPGVWIACRFFYLQVEQSESNLQPHPSKISIVFQSMYNKKRFYPLPWNLFQNLWNQYVKMS